MARVESETVPRCRGCGVLVPRMASGRRLLTGLSSGRMSVAWKSLLDEKLNELNLALGGEVSGYVCRKCFKLMAGITEAVNHVKTRVKEDCSMDHDSVEYAATRSVLGKRKDRDPAQTSELTAKKRSRTCPQTDVPQLVGSSSSPDVQVRYTGSISKLIHSNSP